MLNVTRDLNDLFVSVTRRLEIFSKITFTSRRRIRINRNIIQYTHNNITRMTCG